MHKQPLVSVVIPIYNAQDHLSKTLAALAGQTLNRIEFICIDDGSTDSSGSIIDFFAEKDKRFVPIHTSNRGAYRARESGIDRARGRYIGFCDADDQPLSTMYEKMALRALKDDASMVACAFCRISSEDKVLSTEMQSFSSETLEVSFQSGWLSAINTSLWNKLIKTDIVQERIHLSDPPRVMEDAVFLISLFPYLRTVAFIDEPLYNYRAPEHSAMSSVRSNEIPCLVKNWRLLRKHILGIDDKFSTIVDLAAFIHLRVSAITRMERTERKAARKEIDATLRMDFPLWQGSPFMSWSYVSQHRQLMMALIAYICYRIRLLDMALIVYNKLPRLIGIEIKW